MSHDKNRRRIVETLLLSVLFALLSFGLTFLTFQDADLFQISSLAMSIGLSLSLVHTLLSKDKKYSTQFANFLIYAASIAMLLSTMNLHPFLRTLRIPLVPDVRLELIHTEVLGDSLLVEVRVKPVWGARDIEPYPREFELTVDGEPSPYRSHWDSAGVCNHQLVEVIEEALVCNLVFRIPKSFEEGVLRFDNHRYVDEVEVNF